MAEIFELTCDALGQDALLVGYRGRERLSAPYRFDVYVSVPHGAVPAQADLLGELAAVAAQGGTEERPAQHTHGIITALEVVDESGERALLRLELRPKLWQLGLSRHSRVFTETSIPDIIKAVLEEAGVGSDELAFELDGSYADEPHVCQYKESDLAFISRLMEHEGIYYYFEHTESSHKLVMVDRAGAHEPSRSSPIAYHPVEGGDSGGDLFEGFGALRRLTAGRVRLSDYDYTNPGLEVAGEAQASQLSSIAIVEHDARVPSPDAASRLATVRAEHLLADDQLHRARGQVYHLRSGFTFELSAHPSDELNREYLCTGVEQVANARIRSRELAELTGIDQTVVFDAQVTAIPADVQFRPARTTPKPRIFDLERALVDGPADSDYAQLDDQGRYRIKLGFDESDNEGDRASVRVRMMQPHAGNPEGWHLPLRKGTEVLVSFIAGDPDRPVIAGAVPNLETPSVVTSANHTKNRFHSGGDSELEIEDQDGAQWLDLRTPPKDTYLHLGKPAVPTHHVVLHTDGDCRFTIGGNQDIRVGGNLTEEVTDTVTEKYNTSQTSDVTGPQETTVLGDVEETYQAGHKSTVTDLVTETYLSGQTTKVSGGQRFELYDSNQKSLVVGGATHTYDTQDMSVLGAPSTQMHAGNVTRTVSGSCKYTFDSSVTQVFGPTTLICPSFDRTVTGSATVTTPSWTHIATSVTDTTASVQQQSTAETSLVSLEISITGSKNEVAGFVYEAVGLKLSATGFECLLFAANYEFVGLSIKTTPFKTDKQPIKIFGA